MQKYLFPTNLTNNRLATTPMEKQTTVQDTRTCTFDLHPDFTSEAFRVRVNTLILSNGTLTAYVEDIFNKSINRYVRYPFTEEMRESVRDAATAHFTDLAFQNHSLTDIKIYF